MPDRTNAFYAINDFGILELWYVTDEALDDVNNSFNANYASAHDFINAIPVGEKLVGADNSTNTTNAITRQDVLDWLMGNDPPPDASVVLLIMEGLDRVSTNYIAERAFGEVDPNAHWV